MALLITACGCMERCLAFDLADCRPEAFAQISGGRAEQRENKEGNLLGFKQSEQRENSTVPMMPIRPGLPPVAGVRILTTELHDEVACQGGSLSRQPCRLGPCRLTKPECHNFAPTLLPSLSFSCIGFQFGCICKRGRWHCTTCSAGDYVRAMRAIGSKLKQSKCQ